MKSSRGCFLTVLTLIAGLTAHPVAAQTPGVSAGVSALPSGVPMSTSPWLTGQPGGLQPGLAASPSPGLANGSMGAGLPAGTGVVPAATPPRGAPMPFAQVSNPGVPVGLGPQPMPAMPLGYSGPGYPGPGYPGPGYGGSGYPMASPAGMVPPVPSYPSPYPTMGPAYALPPAAYGAQPTGYGDAGIGYGTVPASMVSASGSMGPGGPVGYPSDGALMGPPPGLMPPAMSMGEHGGPIPGEGFCPECHGMGCDFCAGFGRGVLAGFLSHLLPYGEGGQCEPRWFDVSMDAMYLRRDNVCRRVNFTSLGPGPNPDIVLSTDDLDFQDQAGFRFTGAWQIWAGSNIEFTYYGLFNWADSASVSDSAGDLFSSLTGFGTFPPGGFPQTDNSVFQSIGYSSSIDTLELNVRKRFTAPNCRVQGSWLAGARYVYLLEDFDYKTRGELLTRDGQMDYSIRTRNSLTGFQVGGDLWTTIVPGIKVGGELKAGVFGNYANAKSEIVATQPDAVFREDNDINDVAFVSDASLQAIWRVNPNWTIRFGYNFLYIDGVALAPEQYNDSAPPNVISPFLRAVKTSDDGYVFYHGANVGFEWMW
jgi:hypothetical protein